MKKSEEAYLKLAQEYDDDSNHKKVKKYCKKALKINPNSYRAYTILGDSYLDIDEEMALEHYTKALALNPNVAEVYVSLGQFFHYQKNKLRKAKRYYKNALKIDAKDVNALYELANISYLKGAYQEAIQTYKKVLEIDREQRYVYHDLTKTYMLIKEYDLAIEIYKNLIEETPKNVNYHFKLAEIYETLKEYDKSIAIYQTVLQHYPNFTLAYNYMAKNYEAMPNPDYSKALEYYQKALARHPNNQQAHWGLNRVYIKLSNYVEAIKHSKKIVKLYPKCSAAHYNLGLDYLNHSEPNFKKAKKRFLKAMKLDKKKDSSYLGLFECQLVQDRVLDSVLEERYQALFVNQNQDEALCTSNIQYRLLKILNDINFSQPYDLEVWEKEYQKCPKLNWNWTAIDRWLEAKDEGEIKNELIKAVRLFKEVSRDENE